MWAAEKKAVVLFAFGIVDSKVCFFPVGFITRAILEVGCWRRRR